MTQSHYVLKLFVDTINETLAEQELQNLDLLYKYKEAAVKHNTVVDRYLKSREENVYVDAGFDLFCPEHIVIAGFKTGKVNHKVKCAMEFVLSSTNTLPVGYYLYPRSSTGSKTPLRLANSVGIIDAGYRGDLIAVFDNWQETSYEIEPYQRLAQICPSNLTYPMYVQLVETEADLGVTERGSGGFGSTGK